MLQIKRSELKQLAQNKLGDDSIESQNKILVMISTSLAARTSYTVREDEKEIDYERMSELHDKLIELKHLSPLEHCARAMSDLEYYSFIKGKVPTGRDDYGILNYEYYPYSGGITNREGKFWMGFNEANSNNGDRFGWCRNFKGFCSYRSILEDGI